jgi:hypothetical protein
VDVVGEDTLAVDLDNRDELPVGGLELWDAVDRDQPKVVGADLLHDLERTLAQMAAGCGVEGDPAQGYRPRVTVASATRRTASP